MFADLHENIKKSISRGDDILLMKYIIIDKYNQILLSYLTAEPHWLASLDRFCCDIYQGLNRLIIVNRFSSPNYIS